MVEFHVLRCADCETFQVLQVTKSQKWKCKLCGKKQSVIKVYGCGTGAECRKHVQKLNTLRGEFNLIQEEASFRTPASSLNLEKDNPVMRQTQTSQWAKFMASTPDHASDDDDENDISAMDGVRVTTDRTLFEAEQKQAKYNKRKMSHKDESYSQQQSSWKSKRYSRGSDNSDKAMDINKPLKSSPFLTQCVPSSYESSAHSFNRQSTSSQQSSLYSFNINRQPPSHQSSLHSLNTKTTKRQQERDTILALRKNSWEKAENASFQIQKISDHDVVQPKTVTADWKTRESGSGDTFPWMSLQGKVTDNNVNSLQANKLKSPNNKTKTLGGNKFSSQSSKWSAFLDDDPSEDIEPGDDDELDCDDCGQLTVCLPITSYSKPS